MSIEKREKVLEKLKTKYQGFGSTLASEKLDERDGLKVSKETVRQIMIEAGLHRPKTRKKDRTHPIRLENCYILPRWTSRRNGPYPSGIGP
jgi:transposase